MKSQKGFVVMTLLSVLPLLISASLGILGLIWFISAKEKLQWICEEGVLEAQKNLLEGAQRLTQLNPHVEYLVLEKKFLQQAIKAAFTPAEKAALTARLLIIIGQMHSLRRTQLTIISSSQALAEKSLSQTATKSRRHALGIQKLWRSRPLTHQTSYNKAQIAMEARYKDPLIPIYLYPISYEYEQHLNVRIHLSGQIFPKWLSTLTPESFRWRESCASQPQHKGEFRWQSSLAAAK